MSQANHDARPAQVERSLGASGASRKTQVLIVGAGPTGLALAAQLQRYGIEFVIIDKKEGITDLSKALVVQARTLELFDQIGLAKEAHDQGEPLQHILMLNEGKIAAHPDFSEVGARISEFPYFLVLEQSKTERLLYDHIRGKGGDVHWKTELAHLDQSASGVIAMIGADGAEETISADYLVGCDGASSVVRHQLDLGFEGSTFPRLFYVADVEMNFEIPEAMTKFEPIRELVFPTLSETAINYRDQSLGRAHDTGHLKVKSGERMPYFKVDGESIYHRLRAAKFHAIIFFNSEATPAAYGDSLGDWVDVTTCPLNEGVREIFGTSEPFTMLLRPDNYVAIHAKGDSLGFIEDYLASLLLRSETKD
jgi:hypothetical protein